VRPEGEKEMSMTTEREMRRAILGTLAPSTGRDLDEWIRLIRFKGPRQMDGLVQWLENDHGLGHVTAQILAAEALGSRDH